MKYPECESCFWYQENRDICEDCEDADHYEPLESDEWDEGVSELKRMVFVPRHVEIVDDPDEGIPDWLLHREEYCD